MEPHRECEHLEGIVENRTQELKDSEERFRLTFEQAAVGIAHVSPEGKWQRINNQFCRIMGYTSGELHKLGFQDITYEDDMEKDLMQIRQLLTGEIRRYSMEKRHVRKDASLVWINLTVSLVRRDSGEPKYFIVIFEDISERKKAEKKNRRLEQELRQARKMAAVGALVGGIAHDFNNLLMAIDGNVNFAFRASKGISSVRQDLLEARRATARAKDLTRQLLLFSRNQPLETSQFNLNDVIDGLSKMP